MTETKPKMSEKITVWITKYALTEGIYEEDVETCPAISENMVSVLGKFNQCFHKGDWFINKADAIAKAEFMRIKKIKALKNQINRLESLSFE